MQKTKLDLMFAFISHWISCLAETTKCPPNWIDLRPYGCYYGGPTGLPYSKAQEYCKSLHADAHLAEIKDMATQYVITGALLARLGPNFENDKAHYLGARRDLERKKFIWEESGDSLYPNGTIYHNWAPGQPSGTYDNGVLNCVQMDTIFWQVKNHAFLRNQWRSQHCDSPLKEVYPLCQVYPDEHDEGPDREVPGDQRVYHPHGCPSFFMDLGELGCYYLGRRAVKPGGLTYKQARLYCQHLHPGAGLAQITSRNVQYMLMGAMIHNNFIINIKVESWWLGATDLYEQGQFFWETSGIPLQKNDSIFQYWADSQPDNRGGNEHCVEFLGLIYDPFKLTFRKGRWNDKRCSFKNYPICQVF